MVLAEKEKRAAWARVLQQCSVVLGFSWLVLLVYLGFFVGGCLFIFCWGGYLVLGFCLGWFFFFQNYSKHTGFLSGFSTGFTSLYRKSASLSELPLSFIMSHDDKTLRGTCTEHKNRL